MSLFSKKEIKHNENSTITVGDNNLISIFQKLAEVKETSITNQGKEWSEVINQISELQKVVRELPDEHKKLRDQKLIPTLSEAEEEAESLSKNPTGEKKKFLEKFKSFCDLALKVTGVAKIVAPFVTKIAELLGIARP
ncbi:MAG: hypothetical protein QNJ70_04695 [Xenococcaceae cyanobacterium MO_207.B15]|nr:hypothetical protein [Xenococcaceae cyanobacterium MO_207.B15]